MPLSRRQQGAFRPLVAQAWQEHASRQGIDAQDTDAMREWYEEQLLAATGASSSLDLTGGRDFERAMAHFEAIVGDSLYWQLRLEDGPVARCVFSIESSGFPEEYVEALSRDLFGTTAWRSLPIERLRNLTTTIERRRRRHQDHARSDG